MTTRVVIPPALFFAFFLLPASFLFSQSPLDVGVHFSPQLRYISSSPVGEEPTTGAFTRGKDGLSLGGGGGVFLEFEVTPYLFVRGGVDFSYKRNGYAVEKVMPEADSVVRGSNQIVFTSIEIPMALIYRFDYLPNGNSFLVGAGTTLKRFNGNTRAYNSFAGRRNLESKITFPAQSFTVFGGYETYLNDLLVLGIEPYLAYVPARFAFETATTARVQMEAGVSVRLRLDN